METKSFKTEAEAIQYIITRMENENRLVNQRLIANDTLLRFLITSLETVRPDIRDALKVMIEGWHVGVTEQTKDAFYRDTFDAIAREMKSIALLPQSERPPLEVVHGGKEAD